MEEQLKKVPQLNEAQQKALKELEDLELSITQKKGTKKKLDVEVVNLQEKVNTLTGKKIALNN
ncbi:hypothetical protein ABHC40_13365 [Turicibacter sanguinis]|uniref:hypothetical protein n=1 Tax=Turicibacter sanguinis TaxID=154288 RepID=UPI00325B4165